MKKMMVILMLKKLLWRRLGVDGEKEYEIPIYADGETFTEVNNEGVNN